MPWSVAGNRIRSAKRYTNTEWLLVTANMTNNED